ncbi:MAG: polysaccharide deacetylase family protein [Candidatus Peribacteraceae bacterium]
MRFTYGLSILALLLSGSGSFFGIPDAADTPDATRPSFIAESTSPLTQPVPILVYHHVRPIAGYAKSTWSYKMSVSPEIFQSHLEWLRDLGYTTITLDELVAMREGTLASPAKPVIITFDDNNRSQYEIAFPLLQEYGQRAVFYIISNRVDNTAFITRNEIREMADAGMDIQSHSVTHSILTNLSNERLLEELSESKKQLEEVSGKTVSHLAYPLTSHNQRVRDVVREAGYKTATIMDPRNATVKDDWMKLPRIMMTDETNLQKVLP